MSVIRWEDPPPDLRGGLNKGKSLITHELTAVQLRQRPGKWALILEDVGRSSVASAINRGKIRAYRPAGDYEAVTRTVDGSQLVYVRYVGGAVADA